MSLKRSAATVGLDYQQKAKRARLNPAVKSQISYAVRRTLAKREEVKVHDYSIATGIDNAGTVFPLSAVLQGQTQATRIGIQLNPKDLDMRFILTHGDASNIMRLVVFQFHNDDQTFTPGASTILDPTAVTAGNGVMAPYNNQNKDEFRVLMDRTYVLEAGAGLVKKCYTTLRQRMRKIDYNGTATHGAENLYLLVISDSAAVTHPTITGESRLHFTDS